MKIQLNGEIKTFDNSASLKDLILKNVDTSQPYSMALNGEFIPRSEYADIDLNEGDKIDIVSPIGGG